MMVINKLSDRLRELADQAGFSFWTDETWGPGAGYVDVASVDDKSLVKFARLVINECIETCCKYDPVVGSDVEEELKSVFDFESFGDEDGDEDDSEHKLNSTSYVDSDAVNDVLSDQIENLSDQIGQLTKVINKLNKNIKML